MQIELGSDALERLPCLSSSRPRMQNENFLTKTLSFENERFFDAVDRNYGSFNQTRKGDF